MKPPTCQPGCIRGPGHKIVCIGADNRALGPPMPEPRRPVDNTDLLALGRERQVTWDDLFTCSEGCGRDSEYPGPCETCDRLKGSPPAR